MKKILAFILVLMLSPLSAWATVGSATAWDVRSTGSDSNGGGFDIGVSAPGTDGSVLAPVTYSDITVGATTTQGTSVLHPFSASSPGNIINITSGVGCTVQRVEVISVSGSTATFDSSLGTAASVCGGQYGGSLLTLANAYSLGVQYNVVYLQSGTYTQTSSLTIAAGSTAGAATIGYKTAHGDLNNAAWSTISANAPLITTSTNSIPLFKVNSTPSAGRLTLQNLSLSTTAATTAEGIVAPNHVGNIVLDSDILDGFTKGLDGDDGTYDDFAGAEIKNSEIKNCTVYAAYINQGLFTVIDSYIHDNVSVGTAGAVVAGATFLMYRSIVANTTGANGNGLGFSSEAIIQIIDSAVVNNYLSNIDLSVGTCCLLVENTIIYGAITGYGINSAGLPSQPLYLSLNTNAFGDNPVGDTSWGFSGDNVISLTASPFISSTNYALNSASGGGALLRGLGFPGIFAGGTTTGYADVGAIQSQGGAPSAPYGSVSF